MTVVPFPRHGWLGSLLRRQISRLAAKRQSAKPTSLKGKLEALKAKYAKSGEAA